MHCDITVLYFGYMQKVERKLTLIFVCFIYEGVKLFQWEGKCVIRRRSNISCPAVPLIIEIFITYSTVQSPSSETNWFAASQEIPAFQGTRRFITALTSVRHLSLSWASPIQSIYPHPTSWRFILILSTHLRLGLPRASYRKFVPIFLV